MNFRQEIFSAEEQQAFSQEIEATLRAYLSGVYQNLFFAMNDLIDCLCQKRQVLLNGRNAIHLNNNLGYTIDQWQQKGVVDGARPTEEEMQAIVAQLLLVVVRAIFPDALIEE